MSNNIIPSKIKVKISEILSPAISVGICTISNINKFTEIARNNPKLLPEIKLARVDGKLYAINHHDVLLGCMQAGPSVISEVNGVIADNGSCKGSTDILLAHFKEILENEVLNPMSIFDGMYYLEEKLQIQKQDILELLHVSGTPFEKIILSKNNNPLSAKSIEQLHLIVTQLSQRKNLVPSQVCVPLYVISRISRLDEELHQLQLISQIHSDLDAMSDGSFAWTTPEQIDSMIKYIRQDATHEENNREESIIAIPTKIENVGKKLTSKKPESEKESKNKKQEEQLSAKSNPKQNHDDDDLHKNSNSKSEKIDGETMTVKKSIPNMIIIPDEKTGKPQILVNKRTGGVSKIEPTDNNSIIKTSSVGTKSLYSIPLDVTRHLDFDKSQIKHKNFESSRHLIDALGMFPKDSKLSVFWSVAQ
ncbi:MAG: hypothetical protein OEL52_06395 [Nitrosopumilus sp.]|nr:hypothetical protein [Nitrosopumilus sp.]